MVRSLSQGRAGMERSAKISTLQPDDGNVTVRYQSRSLDRTFQQVRPYVPYVIFLTSQHVQPHPQWTVVRDDAEALIRKEHKILGVVLNQSPKHHGWYFTKESKTASCRRLLKAALLLASTAVHVESCTTIRMARGVPTLAPLKGFTDMETWFRKSTLQGGDEDDTPRVHETTDGATSTINIKRLISEESDVRRAKHNCKIT